MKLSTKLQSYLPHPVTMIFQCLSLFFSFFFSFFFQRVLVLETLETCFSHCLLFTTVKTTKYSSCLKMVCLYHLLGFETYSLIPSAELTRTTSGRKIGRPKGSKDGPRPPGAPPRGRPSRIPKPGPSAVALLPNVTRE